MVPVSLSASSADAPASDRPAVVIDATGAHRHGALLKVAGLTVLERSVRQQRRHGRKRVVVLVDRGAEPLPIPRGAERRELEDGISVATAIADLGAADVIPADSVRPARSPRMAVTDERTRRRAEDVIFAELLRGDLGFVARHLNKPISFRLTRHLFCHLPITPNQVTLLAGVIGLCGAFLIATGSYAAVVAGFALAHLQSVLDGCDGELARVRFQQSAVGEWLDTIVDDVLNFALMIALGLALRNPERSAVPGDAIIAFVAAGMMLFYNVVAYSELIRQGEGGEVLKVRWWFTRGQDMKALAQKRASGASGWLYAIGRRDFFVLAWFVLALFDLLPVVALYALFVALTSFVGACGQILWRLARRR